MFLREKFFNDPRSSDANLFWIYILSYHDISSNNVTSEHCLAYISFINKMFHFDGIFVKSSLKNVS